MSMIEEIKAAEKAADESQQLATLEARNLLRDAEDKARQEAEALLVTARNKAKEAVTKAETTAKTQAQEILTKRSAEDAALTQAAEGNIPQAVKYILEKVVV